MSDELELRVSRIEAYLDEVDRDWRRSRIPRFSSGAPSRAPLVVDEDQTRRDRIALGLESAPAEPKKKNNGLQKLNPVPPPDDGGAGNPDAVPPGLVKTNDDRGPEAA